MNKILIKRAKTLKDQLIKVPCGTSVFVSLKDFTEMHVRKTVKELNNCGYSYEASTSKLITEIKVTHIK